MLVFLWLRGLARSSWVPSRRKRTRLPHHQNRHASRRSTSRLVKLQGLGAELAATRKELSETQQQLEKMMALLERVAEKVKA